MPRGSGAPRGSAKAGAASRARPTVTAPGATPATLAVSGRSWRDIGAPWVEVVSRLNRTVRGWAAYFYYGSLAKARHNVQVASRPELVARASRPGRHRTMSSAVPARGTGQSRQARHAGARGRRGTRVGSANGRREHAGAPHHLSPCRRLGLSPTPYALQYLRSSSTTATRRMLAT